MRVSYRFSEFDDAKLLTDLRLEVIRSVARQPKMIFEESFISDSIEYFKYGEHITVLAFDGSEAIGCATMCYINVMPTYDHPNGKRAHLMNVYVKEKYRRNGIASNMCKMLIDASKQLQITNISLDATEIGKPLYKSLGFSESGEYMEMNIKYRKEC